MDWRRPHEKPKEINPQYWENHGWVPPTSSSKHGRVKVLRHQTSKAFCRFGQSSPEVEKRSNQERRMVCCCFMERVRIVWLIPSSTTFLSRLRQHLCIHPKSSTKGCNHVCNNRNRTSFGDNTCICPFQCSTLDERTFSRHPKCSLLTEVITSLRSLRQKYGAKP